MIKRIIGILATIAILAIVVFTVLGFGSYQSMLPEDLLQSSEVGSAVEVESASGEVVEQ